MKFTTIAAPVCALAAVLVLAGCDSGGSAVQTRERETAATEPAVADTVAPVETAAAEATPPPITANRRETADAKIQRLYERNGADFGARSPEDYLAKVRAFTRNPPSGVDTASRPNGDTLFYQASTNTFAVVARDGTPRTMFKPREGAAYWAEQKERAPTFGRRRASED